MHPHYYRHPVEFLPWIAKSTTGIKTDDCTSIFQKLRPILPNRKGALVLPLVTEESRNGNFSPYPLLCKRLHHLTGRTGCHPKREGAKEKKSEEIGNANLLPPPRTLLKKKDGAGNEEGGEENRIVGTKREKNECGDEEKRKGECPSTREEHPIQTNNGADSTSSNERSVANIR